MNLGGVVNGLRAFVPHLLASGRPGHVLITASLAGLATFPGGGAYAAATKHAVVAVAEQTALALADTPVGVTMLCPVLVRSAMSPTGVDPAEVADEALHARAGGEVRRGPGSMARRGPAARRTPGQRPTAHTTHTRLITNMPWPSAASTKTIYPQ